MRLEPGVAAELLERRVRRTELFEDYCGVTESVRKGIAVEVGVAPVVRESAAPR